MATTAETDLTEGAPRSASAGEPPGPRGWRANLGAARALLSEPCGPLTEMAAAHGATFQIRLGPRRLVVVGDPAHADAVLREDRDAFRWGRVFRNLTVVVGRSSLLVSDGDEHRRKRRAVQPAFARRRLDGWLPLIVAETDRLIDELCATAPNGADGRVPPHDPVSPVTDVLPDAAGGPGDAVVADRPVTPGERVGTAGPDGRVTADLYRLGRLLVRRAVVRVLFGTSLGERADTIGELLEPAMQYATQPVLRQLPHPLPLTRRAAARAARRAAARLIDVEIDRRRRHGVEPGATDLLDALAADGELTDEEVRDQVLTLIGAGYDSTSAALAWLLARALTTPGVWERLRSEADTVLGPVGADQPGRGAEGVRGRRAGSPDAGDLEGVGADEPEGRRGDAGQDAAGGWLRELRWADAVVHEALRLHPPGALAPREAARVVQVGPYRVRPGSLVLWSPWLMGRHPDWWDDPLAFRPERHLDRPRPAHQELAWAPFGRGVRSCLGFALAQMELTLIAARFAQRLDIRLVSDRIPSPTGMVISRPAGGLPCTLSPRPGATGAVPTP